MKHLIRNACIIGWSCTGLPLLRFWLLRTKGPVVRIIAFHDIKAGEVAVFEKLIDFLQRHFHIISPEDFEQRRYHASKLNILLTFDDGYHSWYEHALPVLRARNLSAIFFIASGFIDTQGDNEAAAQYSKDQLRVSPKTPLSWGEVRALAELPRARIGGHTVLHVDLVAVPRVEEVQNDKAEIEAKTGREITHFAYPFGSIPKDCTLVDSVYQYAYTTAIDFYRPGIDSAKRIPRSCIDPSMPRPIVYLWMYGGYDMLRRIISSVR